MIQDIFPHKLNNQFDKNAKPQKEDFVFVFEGTKLLVKKASLLKEINSGINDNKNEKNKENNYEIIFPKIKYFGKNNSYIFLFQLDNKSFYLLNHFDREIDYLEVSKEFEFVEIREIRNNQAGPKHFIFAAITAKHLMDWYRDNQFCGRCGNKMQVGDIERNMKCPKCGYASYPRIMPAVIVGVKNKDRLLLTKYRTGYQHNALVAGFTEIGETLEETVQREVMEETGLHVKNIRYYKSQPWGIPNDILMGFYCDVDGDTTITMDESELKYAEWVEREQIVLQPDDFSLTNEMMRMFKEGKE